jgi:hypothetical protein
MKKLHFFWLQGEKHLKNTYPELYNNQFAWKEMHPDFEYIYWDFKSLAALMKIYPKYLKYWTEINNETSGDAHKYCKLMDFAKHFVFHYHGGFFIDRDMICLKPVDVFMHKKLVFPSHTIYRDHYLEERGKRMWSRIKNYDFLIEDCFFYIEKGHDLCLSFVDWVIKEKRTNRITLDSWSVWALTDYYLSHPEKFKDLYLLDENVCITYDNDGYCHHTVASTWTKDTWLGE